MLIFTCSCESGKNALKVLANDEEVFAVVGSDKAIEKHENKAYLEIVVDEAVKIISEKEKLSERKAKKELLGGGYTIYTAFNKEMNQKLYEVLGNSDQPKQVAAVITDLNAHICGVYSSSDEKNTNFATKVNLPCSALKPLSVYAPAIDNETINWFSRYEDSPYTYNPDGPWPQNANKYYTEQYIYINKAIKESINTVAVKCLADYGVENSIKFLEENFNVPLKTEKALMESGGPDAILGNLALGALIDGLTAVDMAGYYQIFANGGKYQAPKAILKICNKEGKTIYTSEYSPKQVIKSSTADIMNQLLKGTVSTGGTGESAKCENVEVAGKTGTDDDFKNNWFVGVTPEYSCAVWHGQNTTNIAASLFGKIIPAVYSEKTDYIKEFRYTSGIRKVGYCMDSGKQFKLGCSLIDIGYYEQNNVPEICDMH